MRSACIARLYAARDEVTSDPAGPRLGSSERRRRAGRPPGRAPGPVAMGPHGPWPRRGRVVD